VQHVDLATKLFELLHPDAPSRYRVATGGRGSAKSFTFATALVLLALSRKVRILACREIMRSIRESVHQLLSDRIDGLGLRPWFDVREHSITAASGSEFLYEGLRDNVSKIKSLENISLVYIEEAETISDRSLEILIPTVRAPGSEIWLGLNPDSLEDPVYVRFVTSPPPGCRHAHVTFADNPWFPPELERERVYLQSADDDAYRHVWLGECRTASDAQILRGKVTVEEFQAQPWLWNGPYLGLDFGFSQDPTAAIKCWVFDRTLYIEHETYAIGCDIDATPQLINEIPGARQHIIRADNARPETISYLQRNGFPMLRAVEKWQGSVEDGVAHLRQYERIVVHPHCTRFLDEARRYSYKVDRLTGDVLPDIVDKHNHLMDALRYALEPIIKQIGDWSFTAL
jgi:phage terminase large subunit